MKNLPKFILLLFLSLFTVITMYLSIGLVFDVFGVRATQGNYVPVVTYSNLICGVLYLVSVIGIYKNKLWSATPLWIALFVLVVSSLLFALHVFNGELYETKTIGALIFRVGVTTIFAFLTLRRNKRLFTQQLAI
jgi:hypothetical protein